MSSLVSFVNRVRREGHPIRSTVGEDILFAWQGETPPRLVGDFNDWGRGKPLGTPARVQPGLWRWTVAIPSGAYIEYAFMDEAGQRLPDSLNPGRVVANGFGEDHHYFSTVGWHVDRITLPPYGEGLRGTVETVGSRGVRLYTPPGGGPFELLVCYDGNDFTERGRLPTTLDNLIAAGRIHPTAVALLDNHPTKRHEQYGANQATADLVVERVVPLVAEYIPLKDGPYAIMGASMGGLQALYTALRHPQHFNRVLSVSGAFSLRGHDFPVYKMACHHNTAHPLHTWLTVGTYDFIDIVEGHPRMVAALQAGGHIVAERKYLAGHNYTAWAAEAWRDLEEAL